MFLNGTREAKHRQIFMDFLTHFATSSPFPHFPWLKEGENYYSPFLDLIELYDFIEIEDGVR